MSFTGSTVVGRKLLHASGLSNVKRLTLELGGKSPSVIFDDCDLQLAVNWTAHGIFMNTGQVCMAGSRVFVHAKIYDQFLEKLTERVKSLVIGPPFENDTYMGPVISQAQLDVSASSFSESSGKSLSIGLFALRLR